MDRNYVPGIFIAVVAVLLLFWLFGERTGARDMAHDAAHDVKQMGQDVKSDVRGLTR